MRLRGILTATATVATTVLLTAPIASADNPGDFIVTDLVPNADAVYKFTPQGARTTIATGGSIQNPEGLVRLGPDDYLVADKGLTGGALADGLVIRIRNGVQSVVATGGQLKEPHAITLSPDRKTIFTAGRDGSVVAITLATGAQRLVAPAGAILQDLRGIVVEPSGSLLVVNDSAAAAKLIRVDSATGAATTLIPGAPLVGPRSIYQRVNGDLLIGDTGGAGNGLIVSVDMPSLAATTVSTGAFYAGNSVPGALAVDTTGKIIVADRNNPASAFGRIYSVNPLGGATTEIVTPASGLLLEGAGLAIVPPKCGGKSATLVGTPGKDNLKGTAGADVITGLGGKDTLKGLNGKDVICGGAGNDKLLGGKGNDTLIPGKGKDTVTSGPGKDKLKCSPLDPRCG